MSSEGTFLRCVLYLYLSSLDYFYMVKFLSNFSERSSTRDLGEYIKSSFRNYVKSSTGPTEGHPFEGSGNVVPDENDSTLIIIDGVLFGTY